MPRVPLLLLLLAFPALADETDDLIYSLQEGYRHQQLMNELHSLRERPAAPAQVPPQTIYVMPPSTPRERAPREATRCVTRAEYDAGISYGPMTMECINRLLMER